jgi:hypothetical protein
MDTTETLAGHEPTPRPRRLRRLARARGRSGQAIVEFALVSMAFFGITLGTIDMGRAMYEYHQLTNAVREGAHVGKMEPHLFSKVKDRVIETSPTLGLTYADITQECTGGCYPGCSDVTVSASKKFTPIVGQLMGFADGFSITLSSSTTVEAE